MLHRSFFLLARRGRPPGFFLPFEEAREFARGLGLKRWEDWTQFRNNSKTGGNRPKNIPASPDLYYKDKGWKGIADWLGYKPIRRSVIPMKPLTENIRQRRQQLQQSIINRENFITYVQQECPEFEFQQLRNGIQANMFFRLRDSNKNNESEILCKNDQHDTCSSNTVSNKDSNRIQMVTQVSQSESGPGSDSESNSNSMIINQRFIEQVPEKKWLPIQVKTGSRTKALGTQSYHVSALSPHLDVSLFLLTNDNSVLVLLNDRVISKSRQLIYHASQASPLDVIVPTLQSLWQNGVPETEAQLRQRLVSSSRASLTQTINTQLRQQFYEKCGLSMEEIPIVRESANILAAGKYKMKHNVAAVVRSIHGKDTKTYFIRKDKYYLGNQIILSQHDDIHFFVISVQSDSVLQGFFLFPKLVFLERITGSLTGKKLRSGTTIYPPFTNPKTKNSRAAKEWQQEYWVSNLDEFKQLIKKLGISSNDNSESDSESDHESETDRLKLESSNVNGTKPGSCRSEAIDKM